MDSNEIDITCKSAKYRISFVTFFGSQGDMEVDSDAEPDSGEVHATLAIGQKLSHQEDVHISLHALKSITGGQRMR